MHKLIPGSGPLNTKWNVENMFAEFKDIRARAAKHEVTGRWSSYYALRHANCLKYMRGDPDVAIEDRVDLGRQATLLIPIVTTRSG